MIIANENGDLSPPPPSVNLGHGPGCECLSWRATTATPGSTLTCGERAFASVFELEDLNQAGEGRGKFSEQKDPKANPSLYYGAAEPPIPNTDSGFFFVVFSGL